MSRTVAVLGATGLVGRTMIALLEERGFPLDELRLLASERSASTRIPFRGRDLTVEAVSESSWSGVDVALFAGGNEVSQRWAPVARAAGAVVVDNSSAFRYVDDVPLVVPEVNAHTLAARPTLIANPNCSTIPVTMTLAALRPLGTLIRLSVATYQSVSGAGSDALADLDAGVRAGLDGPPPGRANGLPAFAFNVVPQIDRFESNGYTREEMKVVWECRKILEQPALPVVCTAVRVPVRIGHSAHVQATFDRAVTPEAARAAWAEFPGVIVVDEPAAGRYPMPLDAAGRDEVLVGRARPDLGDPNGLVFFLASDNLRKGAATNAIQIAEHWCGVSTRMS